MTHEHEPNDEHPDGPEHDDKLPDAPSVPEFSDVNDSLAPPLDHDLED
jgi:hypothetical protein